MPSSVRKGSLAGRSGGPRVRPGWFVRSVGGMGDGRLEALALSETGWRTLENWAKRRGSTRGLALRARIVSACADGGPSTAVAARLMRAGSSQPFR